MVTVAAETLAYELSKPAIAALVKPALEASLKGLKSVTAAAVELFGDRFADYVSQQAARHSCLSTIVFGHQKLLHDLYIPLTVIPTSDRPQDPEKAGILINRFRKEFIPEHRRVLLTDTAGMGKSTLSKFLFLQCLRSAYAIPIFIELRHLSATTSILGVIQKQLNPAFFAEDEPKFTKKQIERLLKHDKVIFFLDGYDEIPFRDREIVTQDIKSLVEKYSDNLFVITSRPETGLLAFPTFKQFTIQPLKKEESFALIRKYDQDGGIAEKLISKLVGRDFSAVQEFLKNPLLTSLLYRSFEYKQNVPIKKHIFYRQVFDALFDWHDATKDGYNTRQKKSGLDIDSFHRVLRVIGYVSVMKGQIEGNTDSVLAWIRQAREICSSTPFAESHFLEDLVKAVPIFVKDGEYYRWSHKSLAEYFAAQYICTEGKAQQEAILSAFLSSGQIFRFSNVVDQIYDVDNAAFRAYLILPLARSFSEFWSKRYVNLDPAISINDVKLRKSCVFDHIFVLIRRNDMSDFPKLAHSIEETLRRKGISDSPSYDQLRFTHMGVQQGNIQLMADIPGSYQVVLEVLEAKKDPLIIPRAAIERRFKGLAILRSWIPDEVTVVDDDSGAPFNSPENFSRLTQTLLALGPVIDSDRMLAFERSFQDDVRIAALTDSLLKPMLGGQTVKAGVDDAAT